uniref:Cell division cycle 20 homolog n=1 Tax=Salmo trutta TaxID=8032 RepID=A0A674DRF4_SALTR
MAQYGFEDDIYSILKLDMPITNAPMARWQRKALSSMSTISANTSALSPVSGFTNGSTNLPLLSFLRKNGKCTPSKAGGDRFIPTRNSKQMDLASFLLSKENEPMATNPYAATSENQKAWSVTLNGYDIGEAKILHLEGKPLNAPEGYQNNLKVLYSQVPTPVSTKKTRYISSVSDTFLEASELRNDFCEFEPTVWSSRNLLAVALHNSVYLWDAVQGDIVLLMKMKRKEDYICSVSWIKEGNLLLWDVENQKCLRSMASHAARVASLSWNNYILSSGSRSGHIHHDVRVADHYIFTLSGHSQEVCGLKWSPDGRYLASGGNDNLVYQFCPLLQSWLYYMTLCCTLMNLTKRFLALAWCPWQPTLLLVEVAPVTTASGMSTMAPASMVWTLTECVFAYQPFLKLLSALQISSLMFAPNYKELVSSHGYSHDNIVIWKYPSLNSGHEDKILNLTMSPDCSTIATVAGDGTVRFWKSFELDPVKKANEMKSTSSIIHTAIR